MNTYTVRYHLLLSNILSLSLALSLSLYIYLFIVAFALFMDQRSIARQLFANLKLGELKREEKNDTKCPHFFYVSQFDWLFFKYGSGIVLYFFSLLLMVDNGSD